MALKEIILKLCLLSAITSCCREEPPIVTESPLPIGTWSIVEVDSGYIPYTLHPSFQFLESMGLTGELVFNDNGRGSLTGDVELISCTINDFTWVYNDSLMNLYLIFEDRVSKGIVKKMSKDSLVFDYKDWCRYGDMNTGAAVYYRITAVK